MTRGKVCFSRAAETLPHNSLCFKHPIRLKLQAAFNYRLAYIVSRKKPILHSSVHSLRADDFPGIVVFIHYSSTNPNMHPSTRVWSLANRYYTFEQVMLFNISGCLKSLQKSSNRTEGTQFGEIIVISEAIHPFIVLFSFLLLDFF